jgi:hypothetical protein
MQVDQKQRAFWLRHLYRWHWISSAICLVGMLLFVATGITLNNATYLESKPDVIKKTAELPATLVALLSAEPAADNATLPTSITDWVGENLSVDVAGAAGEWSPEEVYVSLPRPGGDAWMTIDRATGDIHYELTNRGWISYFNDLHKGRNAGVAWSWFIDLFSVTALVFCITGLFLLVMHASGRPSTWPLVGLGVVVPMLLAILFIH